MTSPRTIPIAIVLGGVIIAGALYASLYNPSPDAGRKPELVRPVAASDHILGNPAAPVVIVEYTDFECPYCKAFHETLRQIIANEGADGKVAWVLRHFPLIEIHENALALAKASECAGEVGGNEAFWRLTDLLYARQPVTPALLGEIASAARVPGEAFATCYASESASKPLVERILGDRENALAMGADGTPFSVILIGGKDPIVVDSAYPYDAVKQLIDQALEARP